MPGTEEVPMPPRRADDQDDTAAILRIVLTSQERQTKMLADGMHEQTLELRAFGARLVGLLRWGGLAVFLLLAFGLAGILLIRGEDPRVAAEATKDLAEPFTRGAPAPVEPEE